MKKDQLNHRAFSFRAEKLAENQLEVSFSSEEPYEMSREMTEILLHGSENVRLERLNNGAAVLVNHSPFQHVGVVEKAWLDADKKGRAILRFSKNSAAQEILQDIQDGIRTKLSVGYRIHTVEEEEVEGGKTLMRVTDWEPYELSIVSIPADDSVGVGRSEVYRDDISNQTKSMNDNDKTIEVIQCERNRATDIINLGKQFSCEREAQAAISAGTSADQFRAEILQRMQPPQAEVPAVNTKADLNLGVPERDMRGFSVLKAIRQLSDPKERLDGIELEMSREIERRTGATAQGFFLPMNDLPAMHRRDLTAGSAASAGNLIATELHGDRFIDMLDASMLVKQLGATILDGLIGNVDIPRQITAPTATTKGETAAATDGTPTTDLVSLTPHRVPMTIDLSKQFMLQSSVSAENWMRRRLAIALALAEDSLAISGDGTGTNPTGILSTSGIGAVAIGTNGGAPTWAHIVKLEEEVSVDNALLGSLAYLTTPQAKSKLKQTEKATNTAQFLWDNAAPGPIFGSVNGYRAAASTQVPSNLTKGTGTDLSAIIFGNFTDLILASWGGLDIVVDPYSGAGTGQLKITMTIFMDIGIAHPQSFAAVTDAVTA